VLNFKTVDTRRGSLCHKKRKIPLDFNESLQQLVVLQKTDSGLDELEKHKKNFLQEIAGLDGAVNELKKRIQDEKKVQDDLLKKRKTLEIEIGTFDSKIAKYQSQEVEVKSNEQFAALKQEIEKAKEEKAKTEEKELEVLFQEDEQKKKLQGLSQELAAAEKKAEAEKKTHQQKIADCDQAILEKTAERKKQLAAITTEYAEGYEALRHAGKKVAVAQVLEDQTCSGCFMKVAPQIMNEINRNLSIQRCNCGRYIYLKD